MRDVVIRVEHLSKSYQYGTISHGTLHKDLQSWWARVRGKEDPNTIITDHHRPGRSGERFWALHNVSFDVKQGEIVGIIGRNGAGKSTLLKIISEITTPTRGSVKLKGRVGSLLEVGTGFHPELTGRENIYLNGVILGMTKAEITEKFGEIVAFAEIEDFIDTPVKRYSSGMSVRLAFAVAAHLEPEILLVDEVLAVGDTAFQEKCLGKMGDVAHEGRTILFVSHNMLALRSLCQRGILLTEGGLTIDAPISKTIKTYIDQIRELEFNEYTDIGDSKSRRGSGSVRFTDIRMQNDKGETTQIFMMGETIQFVLSFKVFKAVDNLSLIIQFWSGKMNEMLTSIRHPIKEGRVPSGYEEEVIVELPKTNFRPGEYGLYFWLGYLTQAYDVVDKMTPPLIIRTDKEFDELGFEPSNFPGYFNLESRLIKG